MHTDVTTQFMGLQLRSPLIVGACPMTRKPELVREITIAGAGAVVLPSLLEEQILRERIQSGLDLTQAELRLDRQRREVGPAGCSDRAGTNRDCRWLRTIRAQAAANRR